MHAMAGTRDGVLAHTVSGSSWWRLRFNGVEVGETGINAALCGTWGCPVLLVTGDEAACREGTRAARRWADDRRRQEGARAVQRASAARREGAGADRGRRERSLADLKAVAPYDPGSPCEILVDFNTSDTSRSTATGPASRSPTPRQIASRADDWWTAWRQFYF